MSGAESTPPSPVVVELRPAFSLEWLDRRQLLIMAAGVALAIPALALRAGSWLGAAMLLGALLVTVVGCVAGFIVHLRTARILLGPGSIELRGLLVRDSCRSTAGVGGVLASVKQPLSAPIELLVITGTDRTGRSWAMRLTGGVWSPDQLGIVAHHAGVRDTRDVLSVADVERLAPGTMPLPWRRPWLCSGVVATAIVIVVGVSVVLLR